ncbi:MAG: general secretion pathway protein H [Lysobacterales bacterium]|jgi:general secretion pathway protein H
MSIRSRNHRSSGFTLVELMVVMVIIALIMGLVGTSISRSISGAESRVAARKLTMALRFTRSQAIIKKTETVFMVDSEARTYQAPNRPMIQLPEGMEVILTTARSELTSENSGGIRFFPDGGSTGGHVELYVNGREYRVNVAWLTGEAKLAPQDDQS